MIINIGNDISIFRDDIIVILDIKSTHQSKDTKEFIDNLIYNGFLVNNLDGDSVTYILTEDNHSEKERNKKYKLYVSNISSTSLYKRINAER